MPSASELTAPAWAKRVVGSALISEPIADAGRMSTAEFQAAVIEAYARLFEKTAAAGSPFLVRVWNFVPRIHDEAGEGRDRYMVFNAARFEAMTTHYGDAAKIAKLAPAATGVGCRGEDFSVHALAMPTPGEPVDNPRQTPAYRYSPRYGPRPPCFARATRVVLDGETQLLVAGTAAIRGEDSRYADSIERQLELTLDNLRWVCSGGRPGRLGGEETAGTAVATEEALAAFESIRAYVPRAADEAFVAAQCREHFSAADVEIVAADLCRRELLVEIEGVARVSATREQTRG